MTILLMQFPGILSSMMWTMIEELDGKSRHVFLKQRRLSLPLISAVPGISDKVYKIYMMTAVYLPVYNKRETGIEIHIYF